MNRQTIQAHTSDDRPSVRLDEALRWARGRVRARRRRRALVLAMVVGVGLAAGAALIWPVDTGALALLTLLGLVAACLVAWGVTAWIPVSRPSLMWLVDRAFQLEARLVTVGDARVSSDRFRRLLHGEIEGRLPALTKRGKEPTGIPSRAGRARRRLRRWLWHVMLVCLIVFVLGVHALVTTPRLIARLPGENHRFVAGTPIPLRLDYRTGRDRLTGLRVVVDDEATLELTEFGQIDPGASRQVDLHRYLARSGRLTAGEHAVVIRAQVPGGRHVSSKPVEFMLDMPPGSGFAAGAAGDSSAPGTTSQRSAGGTESGESGGASEASPSKPRQKDGAQDNDSPTSSPDQAEPSPESSRRPDAPHAGRPPERKPQEPSPSSPDRAEDPSPQRPRDPAPDPERRSADPPRPLGAPERTPVKTSPRFVMPLLDDKGRVLDKERWVLRHLPGGTQPSDPDPATEPRSSWRDRIERYRQRMEAVMDRRGVNEAERIRFLRYLDALKQP